MQDHYHRRGCYRSHLGGVLAKSRPRSSRKSRSLLDLVCAEITQGIQVYEATEAKGESDELVHICPNVNSVLIQLGIDIEARNGRPLAVV